MPFTGQTPQKASSKGPAWWRRCPAENEACRLGLPCPEPCVEEAIEGLRQDMLGLGLIWDEPQPDRDRRRQIRTRWSLTDDVIPRRHDNDEDTDTGETTETRHPADKEKAQ